MKVMIDGSVHTDRSQTDNSVSKDVCKVEAEEQVRRCSRCSSLTPQIGHLDYILCWRRFITLPVAMSLLRNLEINRIKPNLAEVLASCRQSQETME